MVKESSPFSSSSSSLYTKDFCVEFVGLLGNLYSSSCVYARVLIIIIIIIRGIRIRITTNIVSVMLVAGFYTI